MKPIIHGILGDVAKSVSGRGGFSWSSYWATQNLYAVGRSGLVIPNNIGNDLSIIPSCAKIQSTDYIYKSTANYQSGDSSGYIEAEFYFDNTTAVTYIFATTDEATSQRFAYLYIQSKYLYFAIRQNITTVFFNRIRTTSVLSIGWHKAKLISNGGAYSIILDGTTLTVGAGLTLADGNNDGRWINLVTGRDNIMIGCFKDSGGLLVPSNTWYINYVDYNNTNKWIFTGKGINVFDIIGTLHLAWTGTDHLSYSASSLSLLLDSGYSKWTKDGSLDEFVPYKSGLAQDVSAYLSGYSKLSDYPGSLTTHNLAPSLIDFDPTVATPEQIAVLDRSNETYQSALSRAATDYDASNPYRYEVSNWSDPRILTTFFNVGYAGMPYQKISTELISEEYYPKTLDEILLTKADKTGAAQYKIMVYCGTDVYAI